MSAAQHTPGPWMYWTQGNTIRSETHGFVAGLNDVSPADGRLMIAAPDPLEVARLLVDANCPEAIAFATQRAHAAIAKATGGAA